MGIYCRGLLFETVNTQGNGARTPRKGRRKQPGTGSDGGRGGDVFWLVLNVNRTVVTEYRLLYRRQTPDRQAWAQEG